MVSTKQYTRTSEFSKMTKIQGQEKKKVMISNYFYTSREQLENEKHSLY